VTLPPGTRTSASPAAPRPPRPARYRARARRWWASLAAATLLTGLLATTAGPAAVAHESRTTSHDSAHRATHRADHHRGIRVRRAFFGLHDGSGQAYGRLPFGSLRLWDAGVTWKDVETAPGVYDWTRLDSLVSAAQAHHVQVTLVLGMTPSFYAATPSTAPARLHDYARYVRAVMTRYRSFHGHRGVKAYQVWNEGNISYFWSGTPHELALLTRIVDHVRNQVDPHATVVAPSFAVRLRYQRQWMARYQHQRIGGHGIWCHYDVNALSLYPKASYHHRIGGPEDAIGLLTRARRQLTEAGVPGNKRIWATEVNYGVNGGGLAVSSARPISQRRQVANVLRTYLLGAAHGLSRVFWYRYDWGLVADGGTLGNTLMTVPGHYDELTAAGRALRTARAWLRGRLVGTHDDGPCARGRRGTYTCRVRFHGGVRTIYWNPHREVRVQVPRSAGRVMVSADGRTRAATSTMRVGFRPVMVRTRR
jgi:polysaccharide biosynthesis protein PslG